jgi:micrococcal nuclease
MYFLKITLNNHVMYEYKAKILRVVDGDTVDALIDLGFDTHVTKRIRLYGINAPESRTRDKEEKVRGLAAKDRLKEILKQDKNEITVKSHGVGKFGRCLGELFVNGNEMFSYEPQCVNKMLISEGHAVKYMVKDY